MSRINIYLLILFITIIPACSSIGAISKSQGHVHISIDPTLMQNTRKIDVLREYKTVELLYYYVSRIVRPRRVRESLEFHINITDFRHRGSRFSGGFTYITGDVVIKDLDETIHTLTVTGKTRSRGRGGIKLSSDEFARRLLEVARTL